MEIEIQDALKRSDLIFIDVRSPKEFAATSIPGAINLPLFNNSEQEELGITYHQYGELAARKKALKFAAPKLPEIVEEVSILTKNKVPLFYCSRGGLRSLSISMVFSLTGLPVLRLKQGYKGYRRYVSNRLKNFQLSNKVFVLNGLTGVGKTAIIKELQKMNIAAIDLEGLASHRGSVFGSIGITEKRSQKDFEALLLKELDSVKEMPYLVLEGEGKKIGDIILPPFLRALIKHASHILLTTDLETRVNRIVTCYIPGNPQDDTIVSLKKAVSSLQKRLGSPLTRQVLSLIDKRDFATAARIMCSNYYDCFYKESNPTQKSFLAIIDSTNISEAADQVALLVKNKLENDIILKGAFVT